MQELGLRCKFWAFPSFLAKLSFNGVSALGCKATFNALTPCTGVATEIGLELKLNWGSYSWFPYRKLLVLKFRSNTSVPSLSPLLPQPLRQTFDQPVIEMKAVPLKSQDGKFTSVYFKTKLHLHMGAEGSRMLLIGCCFLQSRQMIDNSRQHCQEPGGHRLRHR